MPKKINVAQIIAKNTARENENMAQMIERAQNLETDANGLVRPRSQADDELQNIRQQNVDDDVNPPTSEQMKQLTDLAMAYQDNNKTSKASIFIDVDLKRVLDKLREASGGKIGAKFFLNAMVRTYIDNNKGFIKEYITNYMNNQRNSLLDF